MEACHREGRNEDGAEVLVIFRRRDEVAEQLKLLNANLSLIAEVIQKPEAGFKGDGWYLDRIYKAIRDRPVPNIQVGLGDAERPLSDAGELFARWLWLQLPDESKQDLQP